MFFFHRFPLAICILFKGLLLRETLICKYLQHQECSYSMVVNDKSVSYTS